MSIEKVISEIGMGTNGDKKIPKSFFFKFLEWYKVIAEDPRKPTGLIINTVLPEGYKTVEGAALMMKKGIEDPNTNKSVRLVRGIVVQEGENIKLYPDL